MSDEPETLLKVTYTALAKVSNFLVCFILAVGTWEVGLDNLPRRMRVCQDTFCMETLRSVVANSVFFFPPNNELISNEVAIQ